MVEYDYYRGPYISSRGGRGLGSWVWVTPGLPPLPTEPEELDSGTDLSLTDGLPSERENDDAIETVGDEFVVDEIDHERDDSTIAEPFSDRTVVVKVLGVVEVDGWLAPPQRKVLTELACYLALHPHRSISGDKLRATLWPDAEATTEASAKSLRNYMSELRRALGNDLVPSAHGGGYSLSAAVQSDWAQFQSRVEQSHAEGLEEYEEANWLYWALSLVRGRPFENANYGWVFSELLVSEFEVAIIEASRRLTTICFGPGDWPKALQAARMGLVACPSEFSLWEMALVVAEQMGQDEFDRTWRDAQAILGDDAIELQPLVDRIAASLNG
jgi:hypothetical protein